MVIVARLIVANHAAIHSQFASTPAAITIPVTPIVADMDIAMIAAPGSFYLAVHFMAHALTDVKAV